MSFGDVVVYKSVEYVFLATTTEIVYLARILQPEESAFLIKRRDKVFMSTPSGANNRSNKLYCFTELSHIPRRKPRRILFFLLLRRSAGVYMRKKKFRLKKASQVDAWTTGFI